MESAVSQRNRQKQLMKKKGNAGEKAGKIETNRRVQFRDVEKKQTKLVEERKIGKDERKVEFKHDNMHQRSENGETKLADERKVEFDKQAQNGRRKESKIR